MFNWIKQIINESMVEFSDSLDIPEQPFRYNLFYKDVKLSCGCQTLYVLPCKLTTTLNFISN